MHVRWRWKSVPVLQQQSSHAWHVKHGRNFATCADSRGFEKEQGQLSATMESVKLRIEAAKNRNKTRVDPKVEDWLERANEILDQPTNPTKCFVLCTNCCSRVSRAKELESLTKERIPKLKDDAQKFDEVAHEAGVPGMEYYSQEFMPFESRKTKFEELKKELEDENNYMIGLQGYGGTGKSTMAIEVGKHVEKSNSFDRVIFIEVSTPVDEKRIRDEIAKKLELQLEEEKREILAQQIWIRIANAGNVLIILDDVWEELNLKSIGIQHGIHSKGRCCLLLTTRSFDVCRDIGCQRTVHLDVLPTDDATNLFLSHAISSENDCHDDLEEMARDIVNECGGLPVMIKAVAIAFKRWPPQQWQRALVTLKNPMPLRQSIVDEHKEKIYNSLRFSYDYLNDRHAQVLFLLCSIFPKAYEIPIELLSRITIGLGLFGEGDQYYISRSHVLEIQNKLLNSSLLLKAGEEYVKMHDVIREMALEVIDNENVQVIMDFRTKLRENVKYSSWIINGFPNCSKDSKLEVLLVWINVNGSLEFPNTVFEEMKSLRVLLLHSKIEIGRTSALSLPKLIQSMKCIRTLSLTNLVLGDISVLVSSLQKLESLELTNCSVAELPNEISRLDKLRFLCLICCSFEKKNPFEVIARCLQLEELHYVSNDVRIPIDAKLPQISSLPNYQIYHIDGSDFSAFNPSQLDPSIEKRFKPAKLQRIFSNEIIKSLAARAEILELEGDNETGWNNIIPSIISIKDSAMKDLIKLSLKNLLAMKCLIHTEDLQLSGVTIFSKLVELQLVEVGEREICRGPYPDGFLNQLEKLVLEKCQLESILFKGKLELSNLKSIEIVYCSMTCLFHSSTAQSLIQLERLKIYDCRGLRYIIRDEESLVEEKVGDKDPNLRSHDLMFPQLKFLEVSYCRELEFILPIRFCEDLPLLESVNIRGCRNLNYMFGQYQEEAGLHQMLKENTLPSLKVISIDSVSSFFNIYPEYYLSQKSAAKTKDESPSLDILRGALCCLPPKSKEKYVDSTTHGIFTPPLYPCNLIKMHIERISNLRSLFSVSIASSMSLLEELVVYKCDELEHIIKKIDGPNSIFPNLRTIEIRVCHKLESVFPASCSGNLVHLKSVTISWASEFKYVFGNSHGDEKSPHQNQDTEIYLPALTSLYLEHVPNMVSMCCENYYVKASSLEAINLQACSQLPINSLVDLSVQRHKGQEQLSRNKLIGMQLCNLKHLGLDSLDIDTIYDLQRLQIASPVDSRLETLYLKDMAKLRNICVGPNNFHLSFQYLSDLRISECHQLKFILSASISRSLPNLRILRVSCCDGLERIIEEEDDDDHRHQECCFPNLYKIKVDYCDRLKCLFSISTCGSLPKLLMLYVESNPELEQVFVWKQGPTQELDIKYVFPKLFVIDLERLPNLHTICPAIDFHTVIARRVEDCPNISLTSTDTEFLHGCADWLRNSESYMGSVDEDDYEKFFESLREVSQKAIHRDWPTAEQNNGLSNFKEIEEASFEESLESEEAIKADEVNDSEQTNKPPTVTAPSQLESPQNNLVHGASSSSHSELTISNIGTSVSTKELCEKESKVNQEALEEGTNLNKDPRRVEESLNNNFTKETTKKVVLAIPPISTEMTFPPDPLISTSEKPQMATSTTHTEPKSSQPHLSDISITTECPQDEIMTNDETSPNEEEMQFDQKSSSQIFEEHDLMRLFQMIKEGADMEADLSYVSKLIADLQDNKEVSNALADLEASLKMGLKEIACSEESKLRLQNALNILSSHCSEDVASSHGLQATIQSLQEEIQTVLSSFTQAYTTIDSFTKLEQKEKLMIEQRSQREKDAKTLLYDINITKNSIAEAQLKEAELKEQISKLQAELPSKEEEIEEYERKLLSLQEQEKNSVSDTIGFTTEFLAMKKERSHMVEDQMKARQQLENMEAKWSSCLSNLKKTMMLLEVHLKQKI